MWRRQSAHFQPRRRPAGFLVHAVQPRPTAAVAAAAAVAATAAVAVAAAVARLVNFQQPVGHQRWQLPGREGVVKGARQRLARLEVLHVFRQSIDKDWQSEP